MTGFSLAKKMIIFNCWRILSFFPFGGLKLNLLFFRISFIFGAKALRYACVLAIDFFRLFEL